VWYAVKSLDNIQEDNGELFAFAEDGVAVTKKAIDVVESGELLTEASLVNSEERDRIKVSNDTVIHKPFKDADDGAGDGDEAVRRRIRAFTFLVDGESIGSFPIIGNHTVRPAEVDDGEECREKRFRCLGKKGSRDAVRPRSGGTTQRFRSSQEIVKDEGGVEGRVTHLDPRIKSIGDKLSKEGCVFTRRRSGIT